MLFLSMSREGLEPPTETNPAELQSAALPLDYLLPYASNWTRTNPSETSILRSNLMSYRSFTLTFVLERQGIEP